MLTELTIPQPDDWHVHFRDGEELESVAPWTARHFARAVVMPNLKTPITTVALAKAYQERIELATKGSGFQPLMTFYLTDDLSAAELETALREKRITAAKLYPAHATTNSAYGVKNIENLEPFLELLIQHERPLLVHAESPSPHVDVFDRETHFLSEVLKPLLKRHPRLKVVVEHITTKEAIAFVREHKGRCAATITPHHLLLNRNAMFAGGFRPHNYCLPVAKREAHRQALIQAATSGEPEFFLGTDSAPHSRSAKESACGCAGIFSAPTALALYAQVFEAAGALDRLKDFASYFGPEFYHLSLNTKSITLTKKSKAEAIPEEVRFNARENVQVFEGGRILSWSVVT